MFFRRSVLMILMSASSTMPVLADDPQLLLAAPNISITTQDLDRYVEFMVPADRRENALAREGAVRQSVESMYIVRYLANEARRKQKDLDVEGAEWQADYYRDRLIMNDYLKALVASDLEGLNFDELALEQYNADPKVFETKEARKASHILVSFDGRTEEEALARAEEAKAAIDGGQPFTEVVAEYSDDPSAANNSGNLGYFNRGRMVKPFENMAFSMEAGQVSVPVKTQFGYHIISLEEVMPAEIPEFEVVKPRLVARLRNERGQQIRQQYVENVRASAQEAGIMVNMDAIMALEEEYGAGKPKIIPGAEALQDAMR